VKILGKWHYLYRGVDLHYRGVDLHGQVLDCWLSATRDLPAAEAFFRRTIASTCCVPKHIVTDNIRESLACGKPGWQLDAFVNRADGPNMEQAVAPHRPLPV
jgi:transposase-like protein